MPDLIGEGIVPWRMRVILNNDRKAHKFIPDIQSPYKKKRIDIVT
jgi:hypothetical protein